MQTLNWLDEYIGTIDDAQHVINELHWFLTIEVIADMWTVRSGESVVFTADSREAVDAFLYGMALAYRGLPAHLYAKIFNLLAGTYSETAIDEDDAVDIDLVDVDKPNNTPDLFTDGP